MDRLLGAPNIWCWERDKIAVAKELKASGIDRFLWSAGGNEEQVKFLAAMPDVLVSRYDVYQDIYHPELPFGMGLRRPADHHSQAHGVKRLWCGHRRAGVLGWRDGAWFLRQKRRFRRHVQARHPVAGAQRFRYSSGG